MARGAGNTYENTVRMLNLMALLSHTNVPLTIDQIADQLSEVEPRFRYPAPGQARRAVRDGPAETGLRDVHEDPVHGSVGPVATDAPEVERIGVVALQVEAGAARVAGEPERADEVAPRAGRDHAEDGVRDDRNAAVQHPVDDLVDGPVSADGDEEPGTGRERVTRDPGGITGAGRRLESVPEAPGPKRPLQFGELLPHAPLPRTGVHDRDEFAERARHRRMLPRYMPA